MKAIQYRSGSWSALNSPRRSRIRGVRKWVVATGLAVFAAPLASRASISGFGTFSNFTVNQTDAYAAPTVAPGLIHLTGSGSVEDRSIFYDTPQPISNFSASFTYQAQNLTSSVYPSGNGAAFVLENSPTTFRAVGNGMVGSSGIAPSAAITLELLPGNTTSVSNSGLYTDGANQSGSPPTSPLSLISTDPISVNISYGEGFLTESLTDTVTDASYSTGYLIDLPSVLGSETAYVGFTAANTSVNFNGATATQTFSNFSFTTASVPEPASVAGLAIGGVGLLLRRRR